MKKISVVVCICALLLAAAAVAQAMDVNLYIDTAPNGNGSPNFAAWKTSAYADAAAGTFVNMRSGAHSGTTLFDPTEAIVYSTGDYGYMVQWVFWIPDVTVADLTNNIRYRHGYDWEDVDYTTSWYTTISNIQDYGSGVVGTVGCSWWANDNYADPLDTGGTIYDETDAADVAALAAEMLTYQTYFATELQVRESAESEWETTYLAGQLAVPEPTSIMAILFGLGGIAGYRRFRK